MQHLNIFKEKKVIRQVIGNGGLLNSRQENLWRYMDALEYGNKWEKLRLRAYKSKE